MRIAYRICCALLLLPLVSNPCKSQTPQPSATFPAMIVMCEDSDGCSDWFFKENRGTGTWTSGGVADLTITHLDAKSITVHREDSTGVVKGIVVDYTGTISNFWIEGDVTANWPGHGGGVAHMKWRGLLFPPLAVTLNSAKIYDSSLSHALAWTVCQAFGNECSVAKPPTNSMMVLSGKVGTMALLLDRSAQITLYVDVLPGDNLVIRRIDRTGMFTGAAVMYTGKWGTSKMEGTLKTIWPGHMNSPLDGKWAATSASAHCGPGMDVETAKGTAILANLSEDKASALNCYLTAANKGDSEAQETAGEYYYVGWSGPPDYTKALEWLKKSASQENNDAFVALAIYFKQGRAITPNLLVANYFANRAELHKRVQGLMQAVANGSGQGKGAALDMIGNLAAYFVFGKGEKDEELGATVGHEEAVIDYVSKGMSRVASEEQVFKDDEAEKSKDELGKGVPCEGGGDPANDYKKTSQQREQAYLKHSECVERQRRNDQQPRDYLKCVQTYKDSNAIEEHCKYFP